MQSDPMAVLGLTLISSEVFNLITFLLNLSLHHTLFCASMSGKLEQEPKKGIKGRRWGGGGGGRRNTLDHKPHDSEKNIHVQLLMDAVW